MLKLGKQATSAYERMSAELGKGEDAPSSKKSAMKEKPAEETSAPSSSVSELIGKVEEAIKRRNWKLLESFWGELKPMIEEPEEEEEVGPQLPEEVPSQQPPV